jgi:hypothetical protein
VTRSTRAKAPRSKRSGVSHAVCRQGSSGTPSFAAGAPASANSRWSELPAPVSRSQRTVTDEARAAARMRPSTARRARGAVERSSKRRPRPTSSSDNARRTSRRRPPRRRRRTRAEAPRWSGWPVYGRSSEPVATSQTSQLGTGPAPSTCAKATSVPTPDALSSAPGAGGTLSVWAIAMTRQSAGASRIPITSRDDPRPGTAKRSARGRADSGRRRGAQRLAVCPAHPRPQ